MPVVIPDISLSLAAPEIGLAILICVVLIADMFTSMENKALIGAISFIGVLILGAEAMF